MVSRIGTGILSVLAGLLAGATGAPQSGKPQETDEAKERARFVGVWKGFTVEGRGENPDRGPVKLELTITEKTMRGIEIKGETRIDHGTGEFTLDLKASPRRLDAAKTNERGRKQAYVGIYTLEGDTLRWCVSPQKERPETFETRKGQFLVILKKDRKADPGPR